jgi:hypothetical protein
VVKPRQKIFWAAFSALKARDKKAGTEIGTGLRS